MVNIRAQRRSQIPKLGPGIIVSKHRGRRINFYIDLHLIYKLGVQARKLDLALRDCNRI
jgi:hypothetical protein